MCGKEVICASCRCMLDIKLNSQMSGKKDILCIAIKKLGRYVVGMISVS